MHRMNNRNVIDQADWLRKSLEYERKHLNLENADDPIQISDPIVAAEYLDLKYEKPEEIGYFNDSREIAGMLIRPEKKIIVAQKFIPEIRRFTAAHEIGHWDLPSRFTTP